MVLCSWQALDVRYNYGGNLTGLFCTGSAFQQPAALQSEHIFLFPGTGYDGQFYHLIAHDPLFRRGFSKYIDGPGLRYRRILIPGLAYLIAFARDSAIDLSYIAVVALFILLGVWWSAQLAVSFHRAPLWGLSFALVPAVLVSVDRLTVDVALAACCVGFVLYLRRDAPVATWVILAAAGLARETGLFLGVAMVVFLMAKRRFRDAALFSTALVPAAGWYVFVYGHTPGLAEGFISFPPLAGIIRRIPAIPYPSTFPAWIRISAQSLDLLALAGIAAALVWAFRRAWNRAWSPLAIAIYLFALLAITLSPGDPWQEVYGFGRTLTPLVLLSSLDGLEAGSWWPSAALLAVEPRVVLQYGSQVLGVLRGIFG